MNKTFNAVALANKALRKENTNLWKQNDLLRKADEEMKTMYEAMIRQLVQLAGGEVTLPKVDVKAIMDKYEIQAERTANDAMVLRIRERVPEDEEKDDADP